MDEKRLHRFGNLRQGLFWGCIAALVGLSFLRLELERATVETRTLSTTMGAVTLYTAPQEAAGPLVVVTHGFAGSLQMMQYISRDLARAGFTVAAFDFIGHGRNGGLLSPDVARIEGTTQQLVDQTLGVLNALEAEGVASDRLAFVGHSMATDIVIRAAAARKQTQSVVAISMYSEAVTAAFPQRLLVISGAWEARLRKVGRDVVALVGGEGVEGQTVIRGDVVRRAVSVPATEHVAVLFATPTFEETRRWLQQGLDQPNKGQTFAPGPYIAVLLLGLILLSAPVFRLLSARAPEKEPLALRHYFLALGVPVLPACAGAVFLGGSLGGLAAFGSLFVFFALWGLASLGVLLRYGCRLQWPQWRGVVLALIWGLGVFAVALDRYAAAFLPLGPRLWLMVLLCAGCLPFMLADRLLVYRAAIWQRFLARAVPVAALSACMVIFPQKLGLLFTVLPVMVLFYLVYGTMGHLIAKRQGPVTAGVATAVILAWSIAASTPLFASAIDLSDLFLQ